MATTSFTEFKLRHATPEHIHDTSVVKFIGPVPQGWLHTNRKRMSRIRTNYHRKDLTFLAHEALFDQTHIWSSCPRWRAEADLTDFAERSPESHQDLELNRRSILTGQGRPGFDSGDMDQTVSPGQVGTPLESSIDTEDLAFQGGSVSGNGPSIRRSSARDSAVSDLSHAVKQSKPDRTIRFKDDIPGVVPDNMRPTLNIRSSVGGASSRELSARSTDSFRTAPETLDEQLERAELEDEEGDAEEGNSETEVENKTTNERPFPRHTKSQILAKRLITRSNRPFANEEPQDVTQQETQSADLERRPSSDANSHQETSTMTSPLLRALSRDRRVANLVRFTSNVPEQTLSNNIAVCNEGVALDRKTNELAERKNRGYFNQRLLRNPFKKTSFPGELLRAERVLLKIEGTRNTDLPENYTDGTAQKVHRTTKLHWREFIVAARRNEDDRVVLTFHRNRTIPAIAKDFATVRSSHKITLDPNTTRANLYSSLDKTIVIWNKEKNGTILFILRPRTPHSSIEWYAFIQTSLNVKPRNIAIIAVPKVNLRLRIDLRGKAPEGVLRKDSVSEDNESSDDESDTIRVNDEGQLEASGVAITGEYLMDICWRILSQQKELENIMKDWQKNARMGFCWRRYDRLEWIHGHSARQLVGQWAMQATHELEFRPKQHYATETNTPSGTTIREPAPIEGFLVRLTSSLGRQVRFGKVFYKRLYFSSHDNMLFFTRPDKSTPPPPPGLKRSDIDNIDELLRKTPLIYSVDPYPLQEDHGIRWLHESTSMEEAALRDRIAVLEAARRVKNLQEAEGYIDLSEVVQIRRYRPTREEVANNIDHDGDAVDFDTTGRDDDDLLPQETGVVDGFDDDRVFELVLLNGLVIRLQSFNGHTRQVWMTEIAALVRYWKLRKASDAAELRNMRQANLDALQVDEEVEGLVGQYASKWEVVRCVSEPKVYNFCGLSSCRTIAHRGLLYRKSRVHSTFKKYDCIVSHGRLMMYNHMHWDASGNMENHIHHSKYQVVELAECYIYSGIVAETELLATRETSDREGPGRHTLPRLYGDGWTAQDEQEALCFVIWTGRRRAALSGVDKADSEKNSVSRLGVAGRSAIYMARSRQERDHWVQTLNYEIERCHAANRGS